MSMTGVVFARWRAYIITHTHNTTHHTHEFKTPGFDANAKQSTQSQQIITPQVGYCYY